MAKVTSVNYEHEAFTYNGERRQRPTKVTATVKKGTQSKRSREGSTALSLIGSRGATDRRPLDTEGGHLIAHSWGGTGGAENLVPMYGNLNRGDWKARVEAWVESLVLSGDVQLVIECQYSYSDDPRIPARFKVQAVHKNQTTVRWMIQTPPLRQRVEAPGNMVVGLHQVMGKLHNWRVENYLTEGRLGLKVPYLGPRPYAALDYLLWDGAPALQGIRIENRRRFSAQQREYILLANRIRNGGFLRSDEDDDPYPELRQALGSDQSAEVDHIVPFFVGGSNAFSNAQVVSRAHNNKKRSQISQEDLDSLPRRRSKRRIVKAKRRL